jgi:hypothetical protein
VPEGVKALVGVCRPLVGAVEGEPGGCEVGRPQGTLAETGMHASVEQMGGVRRPQGMDGDAHFCELGPVFGCAEGALDAGAPPRRGRRRTVGVIAPGGGKEPGLVTMGLPVGAEQREGLGGQRDVPVFGALATMARDLEALAIDVRALEGEGFMEPEAQARDRGAGDLVVERGGGGQEPPDFFSTEHSRERVGGWRTQACEGVPVTWEDVRRAEAATARAEAHGRWGEAVDVCAVQEGALQLLFRDAVGGRVVELREQADFPDRGLLGTLALAAELQRSKHVLTQWGHERSPFVR